MTLIKSRLSGVLLYTADKALHRLQIYLDSMNKMLQLQANLLKMVILMFKIWYWWLQLLDSVVKSYRGAADL